MKITIEQEAKAEVWIPLSQGKVTVIDFDDFEKVRGMKWSARPNYKSKDCWYAYRLKPGGKPGQQLQLHRFLTDAPPGLEVNHIDGDGLNNRRENLQVCTRQQNLFAFKRKSKNATSKYRGVYWRSRDCLWHAQIRYATKSIRLGRFQSEEDAARAYDTKARELFGEYAAPNFAI